MYNSALIFFFLRKQKIGFYNQSESVFCDKDELYNQDKSLSTSFYLKNFFSSNKLQLDLLNLKNGFALRQTTQGLICIYGDQGLFWQVPQKVFFANHHLKNTENKPLLLIFLILSVFFAIRIHKLHLKFALPMQV